MTKKKDTQGELSLPESVDAETEQIEEEKREFEKTDSETLRVHYDVADREDANRLSHLVAGDPAVIARFSRVMKDLKQIEATGHHDYHDYRYPTEFDLTEAIRPLLARHGIGIATEIDKLETFYRRRVDTSTGQEIEIEWSRVRILIHASIEIDREGPSVTMFPPCATFRAVGEGEGEKGLYKAQTGALNYWLRKTFLAGATAADDPERSAPAAQTSRSAGSSASDGISDAQRRRLYGVGTNLTKVRIHEIIEQHTGNKSATSISRGAQYDGIIEQIQKENAGVNQQPEQPKQAAPTQHEPIGDYDRGDIPF